MWRERESKLGGAGAAALGASGGRLHGPLAAPGNLPVPPRSQSGTAWEPFPTGCGMVRGSAERYGCATVQEAPAG